MTHGANDSRPAGARRPIIARLTRTRVPRSRSLWGRGRRRGGGKAADHQVDLTARETFPVAGAGEWPGEQRRGHDQVLGTQVCAQFPCALPALDQSAQHGANLSLALARGGGEDHAARRGAATRIARGRAAWRGRTRGRLPGPIPGARPPLVRCRPRGRTSGTPARRAGPRGSRSAGRPSRLPRRRARRSGRSEPSPRRGGRARWPRQAPVRGCEVRPCAADGRRDAAPGHIITDQPDDIVRIISGRYRPKRMTAQGDPMATTRLKMGVADEAVAVR